MRSRYCYYVSLLVKLLMNKQLMYNYWFIYFFHTLWLPWLKSLSEKKKSDWNDYWYSASIVKIPTNQVIIFLCFVSYRTDFIYQVHSRFSLYVGQHVALHFDCSLPFRLRWCAVFYHSYPSHCLMSVDILWILTIEYSYYSLITSCGLEFPISDIEGSVQ